MGRYEEQDNIHSCTPETLFYKVSLIYELAQLLMENQMHRAAFRIADQALRDIDAFKSSTGQMISTYLNLLQIKAESQWQLRESVCSTCFIKKRKGANNMNVRTLKII